MDPLPSLALLTANINHEHLMVLEREHSLRDADRTRPSLDNVLLVGYIRRIEQPIEAREVVHKAAQLH